MTSIPNLLQVLTGALLSIALVACAPAPIPRDAPRSLPYELPDYRAARTGWDILEDGRIHAWVEHLYLRDIAPEQVAWFYRYLPIATIRYNDTVYPLYHFFHPTEHGRLQVVEPATDGSAGMGVGSVVQRDEWFGEYDSRGAARIDAFTDTGFIAIPEAFGLTIGEVRHQLSAEAGGTRYRVDTLIGSELPVLGAALNWYLRTRVFHPDMLVQWQRHQVQEVSTLQFLLPVIYPQRGGDNTAFSWPANNTTE